MSHRGLLHHMIINVSNVERSSPFYTSMFRYLGYELSGSSYGEDYGYEDWKRWDLDTPHEISICQVRDPNKVVPHRRGALGHHDHIAFCAEDRDDVDRFYREVLKPLADAGLCAVEDAPCDCPEYDEGYYATFFTDPDGLKYEFVLNPNHLIKKAQRQNPNAEAVSDSDFRNDPVIWRAACERILNSLNVLKRGAANATGHENSDASLTAMMLAGFAFENAFKAKVLRDGGLLYQDGKMQGFRYHEFVKWTDDYGIAFQGWEREALDKAEFFCVAWGRYPAHNRADRERPFESWGWSDVDQLKNLIYRLNK